MLGELAMRQRVLWARSASMRYHMTRLNAQVGAELGQQAAAEVLRLAADVAPHRLVGPRQAPGHELVQRPARMECLFCASPPGT